jgi:hypothetical protein
VPAVVRSENDLPTLRVKLHGRQTKPGAAPVAKFEVLRGRGPVTWTESVPTRLLGLADWIQSARDVHESEFTIPDSVAAEACDALARLSGPGDAAYWLELPPPRGYLHFLPWERLLSGLLDRPLLRLPNFTLRPNMPGPTLRVVLTVAHSKWPFDVPATTAGLARLWRESTGREVALEVFVAPEQREAVRDLIGATDHITVHDTPGVKDLIPGVSNNGWVAWVRTALAGRAADVVHIVSHGTLIGDRGALALPDLAMPGADSPMIGTLGSVDVCTSLSRAGAWGLVVTAPVHSHCPGALRDLVDAVAQARPGVVALQELEVPDADDQMRALLRMLLDGEPPNRSLPGILCSSHPSFVAVLENETPLCSSDGTSALITEATHQVLAQSDTPAWVAAGARALEALQARVIPTDGEAPDPAAVAALRAVSELFDEHVRTFASPTSAEREVTP